MSYRKRPYRDKKDEVLAESDKLRKDIENLENALALHTRYHAEDRSSVRGLIRQEINGSRWEYGAEGKLTTFRSGQDLHLDSSRQQRSSSRKGSSRSMAKQKPSRDQDKPRKNGKEKNFDKKENVQIVSGENDFHSLDPSIENIARLINSANETSNVTDVGEGKRDYVERESHARHTHLTSTDLDNLKSRVLAKASVNIIKRNPKLSSSLKRTKDMPDNVNNKDLEKKIVSPSETWESRRVREKRNKTSEQSQKLLCASNVSATREHIGDRYVNDNKSLHICLGGVEEIKTKTLEHSFSDRREGASNRKQGQKTDKVVSSEKSKIKSRPNPTADSNVDSPETERPASRSQSSKLSLLSNLYGETYCAEDKSLAADKPLSDLKSSVYNQIALDLVSKNANEVENVPTARSSRQKRIISDDVHSPPKSERSLHFTDLSAKKNCEISKVLHSCHGSLKQPEYYGEPMETDQKTSCDHFVKKWLSSLDLQSAGEYETLFARNEMDMSSVSLLTPESLREMGIQALGPIMKIMKGVHILNRDKNTVDLNVKHSMTENQNSVISKSPLAKVSGFDSNGLKSSHNPHKKNDFEQNLVLESSKMLMSEESKLKATETDTSPRKIALEPDYKNSKLYTQNDSKILQNLDMPYTSRKTTQDKSITPSPGTVCWGESTESHIDVTFHKEVLNQENFDGGMTETSQPNDRASYGKKSKRKSSMRKKEAGQNMSKKPPASARIADTGISSASQRASIRQKKQLELEATNRESLLQQKKRRDEMAAKHLLRRSSSTERNKDCGLNQTPQKATLRRSLSFTENVCSQIKNDEDLSDLEGILSGHGLGVRHKPRKIQDKSSKQARPATVSEVETIVSAPPNRPNSGLSSRHRKSSSKAKSPAVDLNVTLGTVRELQTRLDCLEEQLAVQETNIEGSKFTKPYSVCKSLCIEDEDKTSSKEILTLEEEQQTNEEHKKQNKYEKYYRMNSPITEILSETSRGVSSPKTSNNDSRQDTNVEFYPPLSQEGEFTASDTLACNPVTAAETPVSTMKQGKGHYYGMRKGGFNFQPVARPRELGISYQKEFKGLELNKDDILYSEKDLCGEGHFSQVFRGTFNGEEVAIKRLKSPLLPKDKNYFKAEVSMLRELRHPCIVELLGFCNADNLPLVVLEFIACGNLDSLLHDTSRPHLTEVEFYQISHDVSSALLYLHSHQPPVLHLDLKPKNVLLGHGNRAKVADFGFSKLKHEADMKVSRVSKSNLMHSVPSWMAPELLAAREVTAKADVYSFGILLWEMFTREIPYAGCTVFQILEQVRLNQRPILPIRCPPGLSGLIHLCWDQNPSTRPSFQHVLKTLEQLPQTDPWPKQTHPAEDITPIKEPTMATDCLETGLISDDAMFEQQNSFENKQRDVESEVHLKTESGDPKVRKIVELEPVGQEPEPIGVSSMKSPTPLEFELETPAGHTTLFVHAAPESTSQTPEKDYADPLQPQTTQFDENFMLKDCDSSSNISQATSKQHPQKEASATSRSHNIKGGKNMPRFIELKSETTLQSNQKSLSPTNEKDTPRFGQVDQDGNQTARDLIAMYLPTNKLGPTVSKSYDQNVNTGPTKKLLPLRHSLDKLKPNTSMSNTGVQGKVIGHHEKSDTSKLHSLEKQGSQEVQSTSAEKYERVKTWDQRLERRSQANPTLLRKSVNPLYADGQPYVPSYYSEIQHANPGHKKPKSESRLGTLENCKQASHTNKKPNTEQTVIPVDEPEANSAFMKSLNETSSLPCVAKSQEKPISLDAYKYFTIQDYNEERRTTENTHESPSTNKVMPEVKVRKCLKKDKISDLGVDKNTVHSLKQARQDLNYLHFSTQDVSMIYDTENKNGNATMNPGQVIENKRPKDSNASFHDLRLDLKSPDMSNLHKQDFNLDDTEDSVSVFSKPSPRSFTPDGLSLDSLSLSNGSDTVVDSLEFLEDLPIEDEQTFSNKQSGHSFSVKMFKTTHEKSKRPNEKPPQMDTRKSFFLFEDSEDSKPFDIINSIAVQGSKSPEKVRTRPTASSITSPNEPARDKKNETYEATSPSLSRSSNARQRAREKRVVDRTKETERRKEPTPSTTVLMESTKPKQNAVVSFQSTQQALLQPRFSLTGDLLARGKQLLKPPTNRKETLACHEDKPPTLDPQNPPRFSVDASILQMQKGQLRTVQTKEPSILKSITSNLLPIHEDGVPSMANILKRALDDRRIAMGDNPESQEYTPEASWSLQDD